MLKLICSIKAEEFEIIAESKSMTAFVGRRAALLVEKLKGLKVEKINNKKEITIQPFNYSTVKLHKQCAFTKPSRGTSRARVELQSTETLSFRCCSERCHLSRGAVAFTLAEVLITLGIIGVVAALTIPTLISNYQKKSHVSALQKSYASLTNGFKLMAATEGVDYLSQTSFWKGLKFEDFIATPESVAESINNNLSKYFKLTKHVTGDNDYAAEYVDLSGEKLFNEGEFDDVPTMVFQDGSVAFIVDSTKDAGVFLLTIYLDINGKQGPNILGRDFFVFFLLSNSNIPMQLLSYGQYASLQNDGKILPYSKMRDKDCGEIGSTDTENEIGLTCVDRIIEEGWKMNY